jgi:hypothetical protein
MKATKKEIYKITSSIILSSSKRPVAGALARLLSKDALLLIFLSKTSKKVG